MPIKKLTYRQKRIVVCSESRIIVKACPGSGKTFSVTARLARQLKKSELNRHQGIAVLSFTNTACNEIKKGLQDDWGINQIGYPHFIGTIDKFLNDFIFLPYGHLEMKCNSRPEIVGTDYNKWFDYDSSIRDNYSQKICDPNYYFDKISLKDDDPYHLIPLIPETGYHFTWKQEKWFTSSGNKHKKYEKILNDIYVAKWNNFKNSKANQADANYFANRILCKYPFILNNLIRRFPVLIVDEAQDTSEVHMSIIDLLDNANIPSIMLIGDPYQAIFEWNSANPELFLKKWSNNRWYSLELFENMRSSTQICNYLNKFFSNKMKSIAKDKDFSEVPQILGYSEKNSKTVYSTYMKFKVKCNELKIEDINLAIVYRGQSFGEEHFNKLNHGKDEAILPWEKDFYFVRDIVQGLYLMEIGNFRNGFNLIEKGYHKFKLGKRYIPQTIINSKKNEVGYRAYRKELFDFIRTLPSVINKNLNAWIKEVNMNNSFDFIVKKGKANILVSNIFHENSNDIEDNYLKKTIHSVKGETLDAILIFLKKRDNSNYVNLLKKDYDSLSSADREQLRIVYVACSRPRKILWIATPNEDVSAWKQYFHNLPKKAIQLELGFDFSK